MAAARRVVALGRAARNAAAIKTSQSLREAGKVEAKTGFVQAKTYYPDRVTNIRRPRLARWPS